MDSIGMKFQFDFYVFRDSQTFAISVDITLGIVW